jgi:hypothetical protein
VVSITASVPLAYVVSRAFEQAGGTTAGILGVIAFFVSIAWVVVFHRRLVAPGQTRNSVLERLNQAITTAAAPAYLGIAVALITGVGTVIFPFGTVTALAAVSARKIGARLIDAQEDA